MAFVDEDKPSGTPAVFQFTPLGHFCCFVVQLACTLCDVFDTVSTVKIVKFGLSEKHTKFEKNLPYGFDKSADLLSKRQDHKEDFFQIMSASQKV